MSTENSEGNWPPRFTLDQEKILNLLTGDRFYSDASAALRESILNAIDAIHRRKKSEPELLPHISIEFDENTLTFSVSDNGIGMDQAAISALFTRIGASASSLEENPSSVGEFGIGVISYFMAGDTFSVHTCDGDSPPIGLMFTRNLLAGGSAELITPRRNERGTTVEIVLRDASIQSLLLEKFPYWCRDVEGLVAKILPSKRTLSQGGTDRATNVVNLTLPSWVEEAHLSPVSKPKGWDTMSGESAVSILYRGIFVQRFEIRGPWGIEGSIDVDPKHFQPRLNRESFIGDQFKSEVEQFLKDAHPSILVSMAKTITEYINSGALDNWTVQKWATLWLSIPRDNTYSEATKAWDEIFREIPAFELALKDKWEPISLAELVKLSAPVYLAPHQNENQNEIVKAALRLLRHTGQNVIRGLTKDRGWLKFANSSYGTTADLITSVFSAELPEFIPLAQNSEDILSKLATVGNLYTQTPTVDIVRYGADGPPILRLQKRLIINADHPAGKAIIEEVLNENRGPWSLVEATARHSNEHVTQVAAAIKGISMEQEALGLVKRRYIRNLLK